MSQETFRLPSFESWLESLTGFSDKYKKYGMFLPAQDRLIKQLYSGITRSRSKVLVFMAPPASGKTHVIALCAAYLHARGVSTCIVTPNNELRFEFVNELRRLDCPSIGSLPVLNIGLYLRRKHLFDYVLVDEAHNIRSAVELDSDVVKTIHLEAGEAFFDMVASSVGSSPGYTAKELNIQNAHDILQRLRKSKHVRDAVSILRNLSEWRTFCFLSDTTCDLKFLSADPQKRSVFPRGRLLLFSATPLDGGELQFYCGIPPRMIRSRYEAETGFRPSEKVRYCKILCKSEAEKKALVVSILQNAKVPSLILLNSNSACLEWDKKLSGRLRKRVICVQSGTQYKERQRLYEQYVSSTDGILLTSSTVFWEGITIRNLRLLIIPNSPYPRPNLLEIALGRRTDYRKIAKRRLIQGMGRIGRLPGCDGICLILFQPQSFDDHISTVTRENATLLVHKLSG